MQAEDRYQQLLSELGVRKRWYQTSTDLYFAAAVAAVDGVTGEAVLAGNAQLGEILPRAHDLHLISYTVAAVTAARGLAVGSFVEAADQAAELLREVTRSKRFRRVAGAVLAGGGGRGRQPPTDRVIELHQAWKQRHRAGAADLVLAAITEAAGVDSATAVHHADVAARQLAGAGYPRAWDLARILALSEPVESAHRFVGLARRLRGRRRKPLTDHREVIAIAALTAGVGPTLPDLVADRAQRMRVGRWRPDRKTALTLAALLTWGESIPAGDPLRAAFHGFALREHYTMSYSEATSG